MARLFLGLTLLAAACSANSLPATTPPTVATTTTTAPPPTTSVVPTTADRRAEIEALFQDLEQRRLTALYEGDRTAFATLFANDEYRRRSLEAFDLAEFDAPPVADVEVVEVLADEETCIAVQRTLVRIDLGGVPSDSATGVLELTPDGTWGFSFVGEGWACDEPHPFSS